MVAPAEPALLDDIVYTSDIPHLPPECLGVEVFVEGDPVQQGSKNYAKSRKTGKIYGYEASKKLAPWRKKVTTTLLGLPDDVRSQWPYKGAVSLGVEFVRPRTKSMPKKRTPECAVQPDVDKYVRAVGDAIGDAGAYANDGQTTTIYAHKRYAEMGEASGCRIVLIPAGRAFALALNPEILPMIAIG